MMLSLIDIAALFVARFKFRFIREGILSKCLSALSKPQVDLATAQRLPTLRDTATRRIKKTLPA